MIPKPTTSPRLLITGAGGFLGGALCSLATRHWEVFGTCFHRHPRIRGVHLVKADLTRRDKLEGLLTEIRPRAVIHAAAVADVAYCQHHEKQTADINVRVPARLADWCAREKIPYGFTSTDLVFDGRHAPYDEGGVVNPLNIYASQKVEAERRVMASYGQAVVFRLPLMIGISQGRTNFGHQMLAAIHEGRELVLFTDEYRTPVDVGSAAEGILSLIGRHQGLLHLGGPTRVSRYALGLMMARAMERPPDRIKGITLADSGLTMPRAPDASLDSRLAFGLGYAPVPLETAVQRLADQYLVISKC